ncbi:MULTISPECIES: hypothetical protein [Rhizobium]|uniref:Uncharacterized protein n=1 Tax=Rhizobium tropici TaxID=398 RepID=A0A6P1C0A5_RHITR|nr:MULTISPECIES: hypothetical protein [Rhizobium]AGB71814.1 hypothetical protein RTCIAT899_CH12165 [Rhizobium tropici CIAT 899]MBB4243709.1 hypothetical protein [Rhizobium tropici]MBB5593316.1 hypothetical protein [Rhizobium tropici]MBB6494049.1 hypothetical protein [Rhizobium tropici]NEV09746.1 hypothetical protein [Rhizobium tropici]
MPVKSTPAFKPDADYRVQVATVVKVVGLTIRPSQGGTIKGAVAEQIKADILSFEEITEAQE